MPPDWSHRPSGGHESAPIAGSPHLPGASEHRQSGGDVPTRCREAASRGAPPKGLAWEITRRFDPFSPDRSVPGAHPSSVVVRAAAWPVGGVAGWSGGPNATPGGRRGLGAQAGVVVSRYAVAVGGAVRQRAYDALAADRDFLPRRTRMAEEKKRAEPLGDATPTNVVGGVTDKGDRAELSCPPPPRPPAAQAPARHVQRRHRRRGFDRAAALTFSTHASLIDSGSPRPHGGSP